MGFIGLNGTFGSIAAMDMRGNQLVINFILEESSLGIWMPHYQEYELLVGVQKEIVGY